MEGAPQDRRPPHTPGETIGAVLGPYRILERIGEGGFGSVYLAEQSEPVKRRVALKVVKVGMDTAQLVARFEGERQVLAHLEHPGIAKVYDAGASEAGRPYFVMEYVEGAYITKFADDESLDTAARLRLFVTVCNAVQHAHQKGVIHRDIKPSNVIVGMVDGKPFAKVIDFGIAKVTAPEFADRTLLTQHEQVLGTPEYMAPEQADPTQGDVDTRADVYSLGVLLYELLTGTRPFDFSTMMQFGYAALLKQIREAEAPRPSTRVSSLGRDLPEVAGHRQTTPAGLRKLVRGDLDWIVLKALEKDRERRYATVAELADDVERYLANEPVLATPPSTLYRVRKFARRNRVAVTTSAAVVLGLVVAVAGLGWSLTRVRDERDAAELARGNEAQARGETQVAFEEADTARRRAENALEQSDEVVAFLVDMLRAVDPARDGREVTVREVLDRAGSRVDEDFGDQPLVRLALHRAIGRSYSGLGLYAPGEEHTAAALALARAHLDPQDRDFVSTLHSLAIVLFLRGEYEEAGPLLEESLNQTVAIVGERDAETGVALNTLGFLRTEQGRLDEAEELLLRAREILEATVGEEHDDTVRLLSNLQHLYWEQGRRQEANELLQRVLELRTRLLGPEHLRTLMARANEAVALESANRFEEAEAEHRAVLAARRRLLGAEHPDTLTSMTNLANFLRIVGRYDEAEPLLVEACAGRRRALGERHVETADALRWLGLVQWQGGRPAEAEDALAEAFDICLERLGPEHGDTLETQNVLAITLYEQGRFEEARELWEENLAVTAELFGVTHRATQMARGNLAMVYKDLGMYPESEALYLEVLDHLRERAGTEDRRTHDVINNLGVLYDSMGRLDEAEALHQEVFELRMRVLGPDHPLTLGTENNLAMVYQKQGRLEEAEAMLEMVLVTKRAKMGPTHPDTLESVTNLALVHWDQGRLEEAEAGFRLVLAQHPDHATPGAGDALQNLALVLDDAGQDDEAAALFREALAARRGALGDTHPATLDSLRGLALLLAEAERADEARALYEELIAAHVASARSLGADPDALEVCAAVLLEAYPPELRDPVLALELARRADELTGHRQASVLGTLALALQANGDARGAAESARRALAIYSPTATARAELEQLLEAAGPDGAAAKD